MPTDQPSRARPKGSYAKGLARRQQILDCAMEVIARRGANYTSLRAIAREIGVTHAALTHHFETLDSLLVEVYKDSAAKLEVDHPIDEDVTPVERMRQAALRNRRTMGLVQLYTSLMASAIENGHPDVTRFASQRFAGVRSEMGELVRREQGRGRIRQDIDPEQAASLIIAASDGLQVQWLLEPEVEQIGALALLDDLLRPPE